MILIPSPGSPIAPTLSTWVADWFEAVGLARIAFQTGGGLESPIMEKWDIFEKLTHLFKWSTYPIPLVWGTERLLHAAMGKVVGGMHNWKRKKWGNNFRFVPLIPFLRSTIDEDSHLVSCTQFPIPWVRPQQSHTLCSTSVQLLWHFQWHSFHVYALSLHTNMNLQTEMQKAVNAMNTFKLFWYAPASLELGESFKV